MRPLRHIIFLSIAISGLSAMISCDHPAAASEHDLTVDVIAAGMASSPTVDDKAIGANGICTDQYKRYQSLTGIASNQELIRLIGNKNGNVKAYAFWILCERNDPNCKRIFEEHINDHTSFQYRSGYLDGRKYIDVFYLQCLSATLCDKEINAYEEKMAAGFPAKEWAAADRAFFNPVAGLHNPGSMSFCR